MPMQHDRAIFDTICERIAKGESLRAICADDGMPVMSTVMKWLADDEDGVLSEQYARAREIQADTLFDEILGISDDKDGDVQRDRLRVDARKWMAGKLRPKKYGDRSQVALTGADDGPIKTDIEITIVRPQQ